MGGYGQLLEEVRRVRWHALRPIRGALPGAHQSARRGTAAEFAEYRPYRQGDPLSRLDWRVFARTDRAYLRLSTDRTVLTTVIVLDASESMNFPAARSKLTCAREIAVALSAIAHHEGDPVGVVAAGDRTVTYPPRTRGGVVNEIARLVDAASPGRAPDVAAALDVGARMSARLALISDLLVSEEPLFASARVHSARGGELHVVHIVAAEELDPRAGGSVYDPEAPDDRRTLNERSRAEYTRNFAEWRERMAAAWRAMGAKYTLVRTDEPVAAAVRRIVA